MSKKLPELANLEQLKKQAKSLLHAAQPGKCLHLLGVARRSRKTLH
jgi:hypothetical protein